MSEGSSINFPKMERELLERWKNNDTFKKSLDQSKKAYTFYDGPPFATGLPHYGHLLAGTLKDVVPRYWTMRGYYVKRRWGWDCHGLPIEQIIDEKHQFKSTKEIEAFGIPKYNAECRDIVMTYVSEWKKVVNRIGRWVDFDNSYKTMDKDFMESVWWVFRQLWDKGLIYRGDKVMQFSTPLGTPLSNFESGSNYMDVQDPALTITFPLVDQPDVSLLAWTTTPWTLISNLAVAVGEDLDYVKVKTAEGKVFILGEALMPSVFKEEVEVLERMKGTALLGLSYQPIFDQYQDREAPNFTVIASGHVTTDAGTGIVHMAPAFGEDDFTACDKLGIKAVCPVDPHGRFTEEVKSFAGQYVKDADKEIIKDLKDRGRLYKQDTIQHSYAFCPRTDTPLIPRTVQSWFVNVEKIKDRLVANNLKYTNWVPGHIKEKRFGNWLENARDWAISRNRFWGNPIPVWEAFEQPIEDRDTFCVGSTEELEKLTGQKFEDIHREHLDDLIIEKDGVKYKRVPEVLDCWFESGSMPYAQFHYPFENKDNFNEIFPAQFIAEGLDQTRGWFYTLSILGTILFDRPPFENVVVNGLILAEDGKKMSKRLKNYPDPMEVMDQHGADALRLYMINSPVIRGEELKFAEVGVKEIVRRVFLKWWNAYSFFDSYAKIDGYTGTETESAPQPANILDRWIISRAQSLLATIEKEMEDYRLYNVVPGVLQFIEELTNTYIRLNRSRFWDEGFSDDKREAFDTLYYVLTTLSKVMAPFAPFLADHIYNLLCPNKESVHLESYPSPNFDIIDKDLELGVELMEEVILLGRQIREQEKIKVKIPLKDLHVVHRDSDHLNTLKPIESYLISELNVKKVVYSNDEASYVQIICKANGRTLGKRAGKRMKDLMKEVNTLSFDDIAKLDAGETITVLGNFDLTLDDVNIQRTPVAGDRIVSASPKIIASLDTSIDHDQAIEGLAREIVSRVQNFRKESRLNLDDRIHLQIVAEGDLREAVEQHKDHIAEQTLATQCDLVSEFSTDHQCELDIENSLLGLGISKVVR